MPVKIMFSLSYQIYCIYSQIVICTIVSGKSVTSLLFLKISLSVHENKYCFLTNVACFRVCIINCILLCCESFMRLPGLRYFSWFWPHYGLNQNVSPDIDAPTL